MKRLISYALLLSFIALFTGCGDGITLSSDFDKTKDFSKYKSFGFLPWPEENKSLVNQLDQRRIMDAITEEFAARGVTRSQDFKSADLAVNVFITKEQKTEHQAYTNYYGGGFGYHYSPYAGMGSSSTTVREVNYTVGTVIIDVFDVSDKHLAWQGIGQGVVEETPRDRDESVDEAVRKIMSQYPIPRMGK